MCDHVHGYIDYAGLAHNPRRPVGRIRPSAILEAGDEAATHDSGAAAAAGPATIGAAATASSFAGATFSTAR